MIKRFLIGIAVLIAISSIIAIEYRLIMHNIKPYYDENGTLYLDVFGNVDTYYAEPIE